MNNRSIYVMLSRTHTGFAKLIRAVGGQKYNHASIALDSQLRNLYAFARPEKCGWLTATLIKESHTMYQMWKGPVQIAVLKFDVTEEEYSRIYRRIRATYHSSEYRYNLFSVLTFPILGGFSIYKGYSCIEFVMSILKDIGCQLSKPEASYTPDDLYEEMKDKVCYVGELKEFAFDTLEPDGGRDYFRPMHKKLAKNSAVNFYVISRRSMWALKRWGVANALLIFTAVRGLIETFID